MQRLNEAILKMTLAMLGLGFLGVLACYGQGNAADLSKLVAMEKKSIDAEMAKSSFSKKGQKRVRMAAFMIAVYAQHTKENAPAMATLREQAFQVMNAAEAGKADQVKALAADLSMNIKPDPAAKPGPVALSKHLDLETFMRMFSSQKVGGFDLEQFIEDLGEAKNLDAAQMEKTALVAEKLKLMADVIPHYAPESDMGKKTKKEWNNITAAMHKEAGALATAATAKKDAEVSKIASRLTATCTKCHDIFR